MNKDEQEEVLTKREALSKRLHDKYPDKDFADEEVFYGQITDDYNDYDEKLKGYAEREKGLSDLFTSDPRSASFIVDWRKGEDPVLGLIRRFGPEIKEAIDDPEMQDKIAEANSQYLQRLEESKKLDEEYKENISETLEYLASLAKGGELEENEIDDAMELLIKIVHDGVLGKFSPETITMAVKAIKHDEDVEEADHAGEVRGRNTKIVEKLRKNSKGDGTAQLDGKNNGASPEKDAPNLGALEKFGDGVKNIFERGGEKRIKHSY